LPWDRDPADMLVGVIGVSYLEEMNYNIHVRQFIKDIFFIAKDRLKYSLVSSEPSRASSDIKCTSDSFCWDLHNGWYCFYGQI
jgi:hypothetical protein